jgi:leukotriene-A4 hydrolase
MNGFLKHYVNEFARKTVTTDQWKACLMHYFAKEAASGAFNDIDWDKWFYGVGMPPIAPELVKRLCTVCHCLQL